MRTTSQHLRVVAGPRSVLPARPADLAAQLGLVEETGLETILRAVGEVISGPHGLAREPWRQTWEEACLLLSGNCVYPARWPIEQVLEISVGSWVLEPEEYEISGAKRDCIYLRELVRGCWEGQEARLRYVAGYLTPTEIMTWEPGIEVAAGAWVRPSAESLLRFQAEAAGTTALSEPVWPAEVDELVADGEVTWVPHAATELPADIEQVVLLTAAQWFRGDLDIPPGIASETDATGTTRYWPKSRPLPRIAEAVLEAYR